MIRSGIARKKPMGRGSGFARVSTKPGKSMKARGPKMTPIRRAARDQECTLRIPGVCNMDPATTVLCHSNLVSDGKGMGLKAPDSAACFGCSACHDVLDGRRPRPDWLTRDMLLGAFERARDATHEILKQKGIL